MDTIRWKTLEKAVGKIRSWKVTVEVGKFSIKLGRIISVGKLLLQLETGKGELGDLKW